MKGIRLVIKWLLVAGAVGSISGYAVVWFKRLAESDATVLYVSSGDLFYLLPLVGAAVAAVFYRILPGAFNEGLHSYVAWLRAGPGKLSLAGTIGHYFGTAIMLATGASGGFIGPMGRVCAGLGQEMGGALKWLLDGETVRLATICGAAAGIGGVFGAPIAGAVFALEVMRPPDFRYRDLFPAMLAAVASHVVVSTRYDYVPFMGPFVHDGTVSFGYIPALILLAAAVTGVGAVFVWMFNRMTLHFEAGIRHVSVRVLVGAGLVAATAILFGAVGRASLGAGTRFIQQIAAGGLPAVKGMPSEQEGPVLVALILLWLAASKMLTTTFTLSTGLSVGFSFPSILIGSALGSAAAHLVAASSVMSADSRLAFVACGMAAMLSAVMKVPFTAIILAAELLGPMQAFAAIIGSAIAFFLAKGVVLSKYRDGDSG